MRYTLLLFLTIVAPYIAASALAAGGHNTSPQETQTETVNAVLKALYSRDYTTRYSATKRVREQAESSPEYRPLIISDLIGILNDPLVSKALAGDTNPTIRMYAAQALGAIGGKSAQDKLEQALQKEKDPQVIQMIQIELRHLRASVRLLETMAISKHRDEFRTGGEKSAALSAIKNLLRAVHSGKDPVPLTMPA